MPATPPLPKWPTLQLERALGGTVCGVDEAGCAPLAGPVVAAAVVLPAGRAPWQLTGLTDSKLLTAAARERHFDLILQHGRVGVGIASVAEIDSLNILQADLLAMRRAVDALGALPDAALVDGRHAPPLQCEVRTIVKGDRRSLSIAAASVIAKVTSDRLMRELAGHHPYYGWQTNAGYATQAHYLGLLRMGPTEHHRRSFAPLKPLFGASSPSLYRFRYRTVRGRPALERLELLELRRDLHAVFDGEGYHIGIVRNRRGQWRFQAIGYGANDEPVDGAGPCAACHGVPVAAPERGALARVLTGHPG